MTCEPNDATYKYTLSGSALRSLHALERLLATHAHQLMALDCQDAEAADAILFATRQVDRALDHAREAKRNLLRDARKRGGAEPGSTIDQP